MTDQEIAASLLTMAENATVQGKDSEHISEIKAWLRVIIHASPPVPGQLRDVDKGNG